MEAVWPEKNKSLEKTILLGLKKRSNGSSNETMLTGGSKGTNNMLTQRSSDKKVAAKKTMDAVKKPRFTT